jgi:hypothetical protein
VRLDRVLDVPEESIRREGAIMDRPTFEVVAARLRAEGARHVRRFGSAETRAAWSAVRRGLVA